MSSAPEIVRTGSWIRVDRRARRFGAFALVFSIVFVILPFTASPRAGNVVSIFAFCWCVAALGLFLAVRLVRAGLWLAANGIVVRNPLRTVTVSLEEADQFVSAVASGVGNGTPCPILKRRHGRDVGIWALGREGFVWSFRRYTDEMRPLCDELNRALDRLQSSNAPQHHESLPL